MRIRHTQPPTCEPVYSDDGQTVEFYDNCNNPQECSLHPEHSAASSSTR